LRVKALGGDKARLTCRRSVESRVIDLNTPGRNQVSYTRFVELACEVDLATILFKPAGLI
jgi:hypothetical protein